MKKWVISDTHFYWYHKKIIEYCNRPFSSVEEMNETIIKNWNKVVSNDDIVYVLGDFFFGKKDDLKELCNRLKGRKILILGNHDRLSKNAYLSCGFETVESFPIIIDNDFILSHAPIQGDLGKFYNIHGHKHKLPTENQFSPMHIDIGVDDHNFFPHNIETIKEILYKTKRKNNRRKKETFFRQNFNIMSFFTKK